MPAQASPTSVAGLVFPARHVGTASSGWSAKASLRAYTIAIDPAAIGFAETVIVQVVLESHTDEMLAAFGNALALIPEMLEAFLISGDYDYYIRIAVRDTRDYERLLRERLYRIPGIRHSKSSFVLRKLKEVHRPLEWRADPSVSRSR